MKIGSQVSLQEARAAEENMVFLSKNDGLEPVRMSGGKLVYHFNDIPFSGETVYGVLSFIVVGVVKMETENK